MNILYLSSHSVLEYDELRILTELEEATNPGFNIDVFSMGAYTNPTQSGDYKRSVIPKGKFNVHLYDVAMQCDKDNIHPELLQWADMCVMMHNSALPQQREQQRWLVRNWQAFKDNNVKVIWRSIGQSTPSIEEELMRYKMVGLKIIRYSPLEEKLPNYAGSDALIRFAKDDTEFCSWDGARQQVISIGQSIKKRGQHLGFPILEKVFAGFQGKIYGTDNEDLGDLFGGSPSYEELKSVLRENRVFFYFGTIPAPYTLSFIEAMMTGIPVVAVGRGLRNMSPYDWPNYEVPDIIVNGVNGYVSDNVDELRAYVKLLLEDGELAKRIGEAGRKTAIELFGKRQRMQEWSDALRRLQ